MSVIAIIIEHCPEAIFDGQPSEDLEAVNTSATVEAYESEVRQQLSGWYPDAKIIFDRQDICGESRVYAETVGEPEFEHEAEEMARQAMATIWERQDFWIPR